MSDPQMVKVPTAEITRREGFGEVESKLGGETAATSVAAAAKASIEAAYIMAMRRPRDIDQVRVRLLKACLRPGFAEAARYRRPVGREQNPDTGEWGQKIAEGLSIRFAEEAFRNLPIGQGDTPRPFGR